MGRFTIENKYEKYISTFPEEHNIVLNGKIQNYIFSGITLFQFGKLYWPYVKYTHGQSLGY